MFGNQDNIEKVEKSVLSLYKCTHVVPKVDDQNFTTHTFLGLDIKYKQKTGQMSVSQSSLVDKILTSFLVKQL